MPPGDHQRERDNETLAIVYGAVWSHEDPDWWEDMLEAMEDDPEFRAKIEADRAAIEAGRPQP